MRRIMLAVSAFAAVLAAGALTRSDAAPLGNPTALAGAVEDVAVVDTVHCRPGFRHHGPNRMRRADGCRRPGAVIVVPGRTRYIVRDGVRVRVGTGGDVRSRTTIRSRTTTTKSRTDGDTKSGTTTRSGRDGGGSKSGSERGSGRGGQPAAKQAPSPGGTQQAPASGGGQPSTQPAPAR